MVNPVAEPLPNAEIASAEKPLINVLYVDDETGLLKAAKPILEMQGAFQVETALSVEEAMKRMEETPFDAIISDYIMPGKDGLEFLRELRESGNSIPFILFTGKGREIVAIKALNLGADQYVNKIGKPEAVYSELAHGIFTVVKGRRAEEALRDLENEKSAVLDAMSDLVVHQDLEHRILWVNKKAAESVDLTAEQLKGRYCHEVWANRAKPCVGCPLEEAIKTGQPQQGEMTTPDGRIWSINGSPMKDANDRVTSIVEVVANITEKKIAEDEVRKSEAKYRGLVENIGNGIATIDLEGRYTFVNQTLCENFGYSKKELIGKPFTNILHPDDKKRMIQLFSGSEEDPNRKLSVEFRVLHKNGDIIHMHSSPTPIIYKNKIVGFNAILSDVTEQKKAEEALKKEQQELDRIIDSSPIIIFYKDNEGKLLRVNKSFAEALKLTKKEFLGKTVFDLYSPEIAQSMTKDDKDVLESGLPKLGIVESYESASGIRWVRTDKIPIINEKGNPIGLVGFAQDITEHKKAEKALQESEEKYRNMLEQAPDLIVTLDQNGVVTSCNAVLEKNTDFSQSEVMGKHFLETPLLHGIDHETAQTVFNSILEGKHPERIEFKWFLKDGTPRISEIRIGLMKKHGKTVGFTAVARDITEYKKAEEKLRDSEEKFRNLAEKSPNMIFINRKGRVVYANNRCEEIMGYKKEEYYSPRFSFFSLIAPESLELLKSTYSTHLNGKELSPYEYTLITKEGKRLDAILTSKLINYEGETAILGIITDITERKQIEKQLKESEEKYRKQFEHSLDAIFLGDAETGILVDCNPAATKLVGRKKSELIGKHQRILHPPESIEGGFSRTFDHHRKEKRSQFVEDQLITKTGEIRDVLTNATTFELDGKVVLQAIFHDITERKKMDADLRREKELMEMVTANTAAGLAIISKDFHILWANRLLTDRFGDIRGKLCYPILGDMNNVCPGCGVKEILETGKNKVVHEQVVHGFDGKKVWLEITAIPIKDKNGNLVAVSELSIDVTDRKKAEEALIHSEKRFRELSELLPEVVFETDAAGVLTFVNQAAFERFGYSQEDFDEGLNALQMIVPEDRKIAKEKMARVLRGEKMGPSEYMGLRKDGTAFPFIINSNPIIHENIPVGMRGLIVNISDRKRAEEALRKSEEKYRETIVNSNVGIICHGPEGEVKLLNPKMEQMTGFRISEIPTLHDWFKKVYPNKEERRRIRTNWFKRMSEDGEVKEGHAVITTKDGRRRDFLFNAVRLQSGDSIVFAIDITESNAAWNSLDETINALMTINEKLNVIGRLTRHDARNKLAVIANNAYLAKQPLATKPEALEYLGDIESAIGQMEKIFDFARNYEMLGVEELSPVDVEKSVEEAAMLFSELSTVKLVNECQNLTVIADSLLRQLFYNLIDNTLKYGKTVSQIRVYYEEDVEQLKLVYEDDGVGISEDDKERIFVEGYGKGTGYGLYLIRKICENYGWTIRETGVPGKGAQFTMTIPKTNKNRKWVNPQF